jgi:peptide/nickel transport system substrate-binding protein
MNPKFTIEVRNVEWKDYLIQYRSYMYPIFITGWVAEVDRLCDAGIATMDPQEREKIYTRLQHLWYEEAVGIPLYQQINIRAYRDWVQGYVPNAMLTDAWEDLKRMIKR